MALTADQVQKFYIGYYARPADPVGLAYWQTQDEAAALKGFSESSEFTSQYQGLSASQQVTKVYNNLLGRAPDTAGLLYWAGELTAGRETIGSLVLSMTKNALGRDVTTIEDRVAYSTAFTAALNTAEEINAYSGQAAAQAARDALLKVVATAVGDHTALNTELTKIDATIATIVAGGGSNPGQTFTLTSGADQADITGSSKNGGLINSDFKFTSGNETVTAVAGTLTNDDVLADGSTTDSDVLNATLTSGAASTSSITNIETINLDVKTAASGLDMANVTGAKNVNVTANANAVLNNVAPASAPTIGLSGSNVLTVGLTTLAGTAAGGTAETLNVKFNGATVSGANVAGLTLNATTAGALETLNIESTGTVKNTVNVVLTPVQVTGITKAVVTGGAELELRGAAAVYNNMELNAAGHTGALTIRADFDDGAGVGALTGLNAEKFTGVDGYVVTDLDGGGAAADAFGLYNIATGSTVRIADDFLLAGTNSIITVAGAAASTTDSVTVNLQNRAATANDVDLTGLTIGNVESITVNSTYAPTTGAAAAQQNSLGNLTAGALQNLTVKGDSNLAVTLTAGSIAATNGSNITVDASAFTGNLTFAAGNIADTTATGRIVTIKGGTKDDVITGATTVAVKNVFDLTAGGKDTVNLNIGDTNDSVIAFTNGDKLALGAVAGGFVNGLSSAVINAAGQATIEAAADVGAAATAAAVAAGGLAVNNALVFSYQGTQYILMNEDTANAYDVATDAIVQVAGLTGTTTFDAGTFLFAA